MIPYLSTTLMLHHYCNTVKSFGSGNQKTRAREGGASVFISFIFELSSPFAKNFASPNEGEAKGGCGGNSASPEPKRSPAALLVKNRGQQKSFLFFLEEKEIARKIKKCEENFFAEQRAKRAAAGRSELVGILFKMSSDFFQQTPPKFICRGISLARRFAPRFGGHFRKEMPRVFEINPQFSRRKAVVHKFNNLYCGKAAMSRWFCFAFSEMQKEILINCRCKALPFIKLKTSKNYD